MKYSTTSLIVSCMEHKITHKKRARLLQIEACQ